MINYYDLSFYGKITLTSLAFIVLCAAITLTPYLFHQKKKMLTFIILFFGALNGVIAILYATLAQSLHYSLELPKEIDWFCKVPIIATLPIIVVSLGLIIFAFFLENRSRKRVLSRGAIKESLDKLPTGLCFYNDNGRVILLNTVMSELSHKIFGEDLQNASLFWEKLQKGESSLDSINIKTGEDPSVILKDGKVWSFSNTKLKNMYQLVAIDVTELSKINEELILRNEELTEMNARLRKYGESVDELTRTRERIETKANIHRELGQALLITKRYLLDETDKIEPPFEIWKKNVAVLKSEAEYKGEHNPYDLFLQAAESAGVKIQLEGLLPENKETLVLFVTAAVECLVNGVRHANATTLFIEITEDERQITARYTNDGALPTEEIIEGGGLSSLRYSTERLGGEMQVISCPRYELTITVPKRSEN